MIYFTVTFYFIFFNCATKTKHATKINLQVPSAIADSGSSDVLLRQSDATVGIIQDNKFPIITVMLPNNQIIQSISAGSIILPHIATPLRPLLFLIRPFFLVRPRLSF